MRCGDSAVERSGIAGESEMNALGVHLVWNDFRCVVDMVQQEYRREESRIASGDVHGEARCFPV